MHTFANKYWSQQILGVIGPMWDSDPVNYLT
ncbi:hypothetical protein RSAG8_14017, partial [Rhizoctonia solani AG-8 WAC10335]